jgi:hypothetical protein
MKMKTLVALLPCFNFGVFVRGIITADDVHFLTHLNELTALIEPMLDDQAVTGDEARSMHDHVNQTRLEILQTWSKGDSAKELEAQLP